METLARKFAGDVGWLTPFIVRRTDNEYGKFLTLPHFPGKRFPESIFPAFSLLTGIIQ